MTKAFEGIKVGDQLEMPYGKTFWARTETGHMNHIDPKTVAEVWIVTARWTDGYEAKDYVCINRMRKDGNVCPRTKRKHTITGLAQAGFYYASKDWVSQMQAVESAKGAGKVVSLKEHAKKAKTGKKTL